MLNSKLPSGRSQACKLQNVLYVPRLSYNLLSVSVATENGKTVRFGKANCQILFNKRLVAVATKAGELYYLNCFSNSVYTHAAETKVEETKVEELNEDNWHQKYGHISVRNLQKL